MITALLIGGIVLGALGGAATVVGGILQKRDDEKRQKELVDYEYKLLGRRDGSKE